MHDYHVHTSVSWCAARNMTPATIAREAASAGMETVGLADHLWLDPKRASRPSLDRILRLRAEIPESGSIPRIMLGAEADCAPGIGIAGGNALESLDFVVAAYHFTDIRLGLASWPRDPDGLARALVEGFSSVVSARHTVIAGHPFFIPPRILDRLAPDISGQLDTVLHKALDQANPLLELTASRGIALELNAKALRRRSAELMLPFFRLALGKGCRFVFASDAHLLNEIGRIRQLAEYAAAIGIENECRLFSDEPAHVRQRRPRRSR